MEHVIVPTISLPLQPPDELDDKAIKSIYAFSRTGRVLGGMSAPPKIDCIGCDGVAYPQIVKGRDGLRGDAVLQQLFGIMNSLMERDTEANKRKLHIRMYKVVPISPFVEMMQFVTPSEVRLLGIRGREIKGCDFCKCGSHSLPCW